jgi:hypothetical protein
MVVDRTSREGCARQLGWRPDTRLSRTHAAAIGKGTAKKLGLTATLAAVVGVAGFAGVASAADMGALAPQAAPMAYVPPPPAACASAYDFFLTACPLSWYGITFFGIVDLGGTYQTHGTPFDRNYPTGASYLLGAGGTGATNRNAGFGLAPNALSQSNVGVKIAEPIGSGWSFVAEGGLAFNPYSLLLANAPQAMQNAIGTAQNQEAMPFDSSRWGWLAAQNYVGFNQPVYGTLTFGRQNTLELDGVNAYDSMGGAYGFSPLGFSGKTAGGGDTEDARWTTAIKYRENIGDFRLSAMGQPLYYGAYNPNNGAVSGGIGGDIKHLGAGTLSLDVIGTFEKDAVNLSMMYPGQATPLGWPTTFPADAAIKATLSNQTAFMALAKYSFGSFASAAPPPLVAKGEITPPPPPTPVFTLYAGYEWIQFANPSDPQTVFRNDGFLFTNQNGTASGGSALKGTMIPINGTTINNNAFNANCGRGVGCTDEVFQVMWTGAKYGITKDLDVIGAAYHYIQNQYVIGFKPGTAVASTCSTPTTFSQCAGWMNMASLVFDWRFLPKWDAYIGTFYSAAFGGIANGDIARNNLATTAGVRFRF